MKILLGLAAMVWCSGCTHSLIIARPALEVVQAVESLAQHSISPIFKTEEKSLNRDWSVLFSEPVPGQKFEYYEITFRILKISQDHTEVAIDASRINSLFKNDRKNAPRMGRLYAEKLAAILKKEEPLQISTGNALQVTPKK